MTIVQINTRVSPVKQFNVFAIAFRPFFLGAALFSTCSILAWTLTYSLHAPLVLDSISLFEWHAHQMIYGFSLAVITGFLLTAIMNWTHVPTIHGTPLKMLFLCWSIPRVLLLFGTRYIEFAALFDFLFSVGLIGSVTAPIVTVRQWKQVGILTKVLLLVAGNLCFYLDAFDVLQNGGFFAVYAGLFVIISLILTIGGRVMPAFIKNSFIHDIEVSNPLWVAIGSFILFATFTLNFLFVQHPMTTGVTAALLFVLTTYRLFCWHTIEIWRQPLLWGLFMSYIFIDIGFLLYALHAVGLVSALLATHAFAYGGIGIATLAMMIRVSLGHTGRDVRTPPQGTGLLLATLTLGASIRVFAPLLSGSDYRTIILTAQSLWMFSFVGFIVLIAKVLLSPRADGQEDIRILKNSSPLG